MVMVLRNLAPGEEKDDDHDPANPKGDGREGTGQKCHKLS